MHFRAKKVWLHASKYKLHEKSSSSEIWTCKSLNQ
jgi:hypothetical protein